MHCDCIFNVSISYFFEVTCIPKETIKVIQETIKVIEKGDNYIRIAKFVEASFSSFM
jgi:hypothetical protein